MYRILIADDELIERTVLRKTLQSNFEGQCDIYIACNGRESIALAQEKQTQIAILDIEMPGINGLQAAETIRKNNPECNIIFLTAFDDFKYAKKAISIHALDYIVKPFEEGELLAVVEEAMRLADKGEKKTVQEESLAEFGDDVGPARLMLTAVSMKSYIRNNYARDISLQDAAKTMNYSDAYFCKLFKQCFGKNFTTYLTEFRVEEAKELLKQPNSNMKEIGEAVGYSDANYFAKVFKRVVGCSPSEYRVTRLNRR